MLAPLEIGICCRNLERLMQFYVRTLGCELISVIEVPAEKARALSVSRLGYKVARVELPTGERLKFLEPGETPQSPSEFDLILDRQNRTYLTFIVDDLQDVFVQLQAEADVEIVTGPTPIEVRSGVTVFFAKDPEGNLIEFVEYEDIVSYRPAHPA